RCSTVVPPATSPLRLAVEAALMLVRLAVEAATRPRVTRPRVTRLAMEAATRPRVTRPRVTRLAMEAATRLVRLAMEAATRPSPWFLATSPHKKRRIFWRSPLCCACGGARR
ncbi:unnamed protein product, partial [Effrenium voratum]